jgi:hypothetical protein
MAGLVLTTSKLMIVHIGDASIVNIPSSFVPVSSGICNSMSTDQLCVVMSVRVELSGKKA